MIKRIRNWCKVDTINDSIGLLSPNTSRDFVDIVQNLLDIDIYQLAYEMMWVYDESVNLHSMRKVFNEAVRA